MIIKHKMRRANAHCELLLLQNKTVNLKGLMLLSLIKQIRDEKNWHISVCEALAKLLPSSG